MTDKTVVDFDFDDLTFYEAMEVERISGIPIDKLDDPDSPKAGLLLAMTYLRLKKDNPSITVDEVGNTGLGTYDFATDTQEGGDPLEGTGEGE